MNYGPIFSRFSRFYQVPLSFWLLTSIRPFFNGFFFHGSTLWGLRFGSHSKTPTSEINIFCVRFSPGHPSVGVLPSFFYPRKKRERSRKKNHWKWRRRPNFYWMVVFSHYRRRVAAASLLIFIAFFRRFFFIRVFFGGFVTGRQPIPRENSTKPCKI